MPKTFKTNSLSFKLMPYRSDLNRKIKRERRCTKLIMEERPNAKVQTSQSQMNCFNYFISPILIW